MRSEILIILGCIFFGFVSCDQQTAINKTNNYSKHQSDKKFFSQDGKFKISFEAEPTAYSKDIPYENGKIRMNYFIYEKGINLIYCISYADYPTSFTEGKVKEDVLMSLLNNYINYQRAGLEIQKQVQINSFPGIYFKANNGDTFVFGEYILRENRLYQITVTKEGSYANDTEATAFIQSLELL